MPVFIDKKRDKIKFKYAISGVSTMLTKFESASEPEDFKFVELIVKNYVIGGENLDLMFAFDDIDNRSDGVLFLGNWDICK